MKSVRNQFLFDTCDFGKYFTYDTFRTFDKFLTHSQVLGMWAGTTN
jgi:hypothetical protein